MLEGFRQIVVPYDLQRRPLMQLRGLGWVDFPLDLVQKINKQGMISESISTCRPPLVPATHVCYYESR
jgi:hypothetical protein